MALVLACFSAAAAQNGLEGADPSQPPGAVNPPAAEASAEQPFELPSLSKTPSFGAFIAPSQSASPSARPRDTGQGGVAQGAAVNAGQAPAPVGEAARSEQNSTNRDVSVEIQRVDQPLLRTASPNAKCGEVYTVEAGDTLGSIAVTLFDDVRKWRMIYEFGGNQAVIGPNPNTLEVGAPLPLPPCDPSQVAKASAELKAKLAETRPAAPTAQPVTVTAAAAAVVSQKGASTLEMLTGGGYPPLVDANAPNGGLVRQLVEAAFGASGLNAPIKVDQVNDWPSHLSVLLRQNKYAFGFPWVAPNCANLAPTASEELQLRCEYVYSDPIYVVAIDVFGLIDEGQGPASFADLAGKRVCRPEGWTMGVVVNEAAPVEGVEMVTASNAISCFERLERGVVDYVHVSRFTGQKALTELGLTGFVRRYPALTGVQSLSLAAHRSNPQATGEWMTAFNAGLAALKQRGEWDQIVSWHLKQFRSQP